MTQARLVIPGRPGISPSYRELAKKLKVPNTTVRNRIRRMYSDGILLGSSVFPNPNLLGLKSSAYTMDVSPMVQKSEAVEKLKHVSGASFIHDFLGTLVWVVFIYDSEAAMKKSIDQMKEIALTDGVLSNIPYPPCSIELTKPDAELILYLSKHGFSSDRDLAKALGISTRTVQRRLTNLVNGGALISLAKVNYSAMKECVPADLLILFRSLEDALGSEKRILPILGDRVILASLWDVVGMCSLILSDVSAVTDLANKIKQVEGVAVARVEIVKDHIDMTGAYTGYLEKWIAEKGYLKKSIGEEQSIRVG
jgi:DNA-binding Lrp family transcriptional regulator